jgi:predicted kinase
MSRIVIVSGPPGAGKSTVARRLTQRGPAARAMHMHTDDMYGYVWRGFVQPWLPEAAEQNATLARALSTSAGICAAGGYDVYADGVLGPWLLDFWREAAHAHGVGLHYVVLMPDEETAVTRATTRTTRGAMKDPDVARRMWRTFRAHALPDGHVLDTSAQDPDETVARVLGGLAEGRFRLG